MLPVPAFYAALAERGFEFFAGVPDSLLKDLCAYVTDNAPAERHVICANEGAAVALACGHHLATGKTGVVYMQNSGEGNAVNPLLSLADPDVYGIPVLLVVGWRGEPGVHDEPQHVKQGKVTLELLQAMGIPAEVLPDALDGAVGALDRAAEHFRANSSPYALVVRKGTFEPYKLQKKTETAYALTREGAMAVVVDALGAGDSVVSTTGMCSRELFELREKNGQGHGRDFLTVGSMGHSLQIALGIALARPDRQAWCLDGDGSLLMHMGSLAVTAALAPANLRHVVFNNGAHDSVGGQPTVGFQVDIPAVARACGYRAAFTASTPDDIRARLAELGKLQGPTLLEIRVNKGARADLGRPTTTPQENKAAFMQFLGA